MALAGVGQHFSRNFDQYTIMCVFGSVVGCVVLPLMAQSMESLIITAILFGVTVKTLNKKVVGGGGGGGGGKDTQEERKKEKKPKKTKQQRHVQVQQSVVGGEVGRAQRELDLIKKEELRLQEKEVKSEEKRKKKAKKREEKLLKREEEKVERERKEAALLERKKERDEQRKKSFRSAPPSPMSAPPSPMDYGTGYLSERKQLRHRERKHSSSSSTSSTSNYSSPASTQTPSRRRPPPRTPKRASSAPLINMTTPPFNQQVPELTSPPSLSSPSSPATSHVPPGHAPGHAPLQMIHMLPLLPFLSPAMPHPPMPHPHFLYRPLPQNMRPHLDSRSVQPITYWTGRAPDMNSAGHAQWIINQTSGHVTTDSAGQNSREVAESGTDPPTIGGCGPAQEFYSFLNNQEETSDPSSYQATPSSNIWTPPSSGQPGEERGGWPNLLLNSPLSD